MSHETRRASLIKKHGLKGVNKPKRTPKHPTKSHIVLAQEGHKLKLIRFGQQGVSGAGKSPKSKSEKARRKSFKARHAKNIAKEVGVNLNQISAKGEKITKEDVLKAVPAMGSVNDDNRSETREKLSVLRRKVSERLVSVKNETAMLTTFNEADLSQIFDLRKKYKDIFSTKHGVSLGFMSFFTKAVTRALQMYPDVNSMIDGDHKVSYNYSDISIAVSGPKGLMTPVLRNAQNLSFASIEQEIKRLADLVREKSITVDDLTGGTFTISNGGVFGSMLSTPIINPPQSGILGMHNIINRPIAIGEKIEIRPMMYLALSYDHRIIDGKEAVSFLKNIKELNNLEEVLDKISIITEYSILEHDKEKTIFKIAYLGNPKRLSQEFLDLDYELVDMGVMRLKESTPEEREKATEKVYDEVGRLKKSFKNS